MPDTPNNPITPELKMQIAVEAIRGEKTLREIASEYGVRPTQVAYWKKRVLENGVSVFESKRGRKAADPQDAVIQRLNKIIENYRRDIAWLKKVYKKAGIEIEPDEGEETGKKGKKKT